MALLGLRRSVDIFLIPELIIGQEPPAEDPRQKKINQNVFQKKKN